MGLLGAVQADQQPVNVGSAPNDRTGDPARTAFQKLNANDAELYSLTADLTSSLADKQALDDDLTEIAALTPVDGDLIQRVSGAWLNRSTAQLKASLTLTKSDVGLGNVDNTSDAAKPISTATQTALDGKQTLDTDLTVIAGLSPSNDDVLQRKAGGWTNRTPAQLKSDLALTKADVGLGNVDNTSDANKPVSTAAQAALDLKQPIDSDLTDFSELTPSDGDVIQRVSGAWENRTPAQLKTSLTLDKTDVGLGNVENTALSTWAGSTNLTTLGTIGAGTWNGTNISLAKGGLGTSLADPDGDRILFWDDSAGVVDWLTVGSGLSLTGTTLTATAAGGDASTNTSSSVDSEVALFSGTGGKTLKRATGTGLGLLTSGVLSALSATDDSLPIGNGTTYQVKTLTDCDGATNAVTYDTTTNVFGCNTLSAGGSPGGSNTQVQFNDSSAFGGDADYTWNKTTNVLSIGSEATPATLTSTITANGNALTIAGGDCSGAANTCEALTVRGGQSSVTNGNGGSLTVRAGDGLGTSKTGGDLTVRAGNSTNATQGGTLNLDGGTSASGTAGQVRIHTANANRLFIDADGSWDLGGNTPGTSGQAFVSAGASSPPAWTTLGANPSGTIGLTAVNGSATTYLRSDAAPALSQSIQPVWTDIHQWQRSNPVLRFNETDQAGDTKVWVQTINTAKLCWTTQTDAFGAGQNALCFTRNPTTTVSAADYGAASTVHTFSGSMGSGSAMKHQRVTTGSISGAATALVTLTWTAAFADANYTVTCDVEDSTAAALALSVVHIESKVAASVGVRVENTSAGSLTGTLGCIAMHD